jgi:hypothetical protein
MSSNAHRRTVKLSAVTMNASAGIFLPPYTLSRPHMLSSVRFCAVNPVADGVM